MAQQLQAFDVTKGLEFSVPSTDRDPVPEYWTPSSGLHLHWVCTWHTHTSRVNQASSRWKKLSNKPEVVEKFPPRITKTSQQSGLLL